MATAADLRPERREAFRERWGVEAVYEDYRQMVAEQQPDLVAVCTTASGLQKPANAAPDASFRGDSHAELSIALAELGVPMLYMEKAMASSPRMADAARDACMAAGTLFNTGVLRRFDNRYDAVRQAIADGAIGTPQAAVQYARSNLMHGHVHSIDTLSFLLGDPPFEAIRGELLPREAGGAPRTVEGDHIPSDPDATFQLRFAGGVEAWSVPAGNWEFEVLGSEGVIRSENNGSGFRCARQTAPGAVRTRCRSRSRFRTHGARWWRAWRTWSPAYESGRPTRSPVDLSARVVDACVAVAESHRRGGAWVGPAAGRARPVHLSRVERQRSAAGPQAVSSAKRKQAVTWVVDHAHRLQVGVHDGGTDEAEAARLEVAAYLSGQLGLCGQLALLAASRPPPSGRPRSATGRRRSSRTAPERPERRARCQSMTPTFSRLRTISGLPSSAARSASP